MQILGEHVAEGWGCGESRVDSGSGNPEPATDGLKLHSLGLRARHRPEREWAGFKSFGSLILDS